MNDTYLLSIGPLDHWRRLSLQTTQLDKKTEVFKRSQNFTEGNTRKVSACFFRLHVCDVINFRDHHERMRIRGPLAPVTRRRSRRFFKAHAFA